MFGTMERPVRVGIVGLSADGGWASRSHLPALRASDRFELVGVAASTPERSAAAAERYGLPLAAASPGELASDDRVDAVVIAVKVPEHEVLIDQVLPAGKPILCEWPLAPNAEIAHALAQRAASVRTAVGLQALHVPQVRTMKRLVGEGFVGRPTSSVLIGDAGGWGAQTTAATAYTMEGRHGATMAAIPLGHTLAAVIDVVGELDEVGVMTAVDVPDVRVTDTGEIVRKTTPDQIAFTARSADGVLVSAHYRGGRGGGTGLLWEVRGTEGVLRLTGDIGHLQFGAVTLAGSQGTDPLTVLAPSAEDLGSLDLPGSLSGTPAAVVARQYAAWAQDLAVTDGGRGGTGLRDFRAAAHHHLLIDRLSEHRRDP